MEVVLATATASATLASHASLFTGKFTTSHGARRDPEGPLVLSDAIGSGLDRYRARGLSPDERTLAGVLSSAGYTTGGVVAGPWLKKLFGWSPGFDFYDDAEITVLNGRDAASVTASAAGWIERLDGDRPFFLFLNYFDPHTPYKPPTSTRACFCRGGARRAGSGVTRRSPCTTPRSGTWTITSAAFSTGCASWTCTTTPGSS